MKKGFTLIEVLAVMILISITAIVSVPTIMNQIIDRKETIDSATQQIIYNAAELYMKNDEVSFPKTSGNKYAVSLDKLVSSGYLKQPIKNYKTGNNIPLTYCVRTTVNSYKEFDSFEIINNC